MIAGAAIERARVGSPSGGLASQRQKAEAIRGFRHRVPAAGSLREPVRFSRQLGFERARVELPLAKLDLTALQPLASEVRALREHPRVDVATM
jgi:hypothetical protein